MPSQIIHNMSNEDYHAHPAIGRSGLMAFMRSPAHYYHRYIAKANQAPPTESMELGSVFHTMLLEESKLPDVMYICPDGDRRTKLGKETYAAAIENAKGRTLVSATDFELLCDMKDAVHTHPKAKDLLAKPCSIESSLFWTDPLYEVDVKARPDAFCTDGTVVDIKTCDNASRHSMEKSIVKYGYDLQAYMQLLGLRYTGHEADFQFIMICIEKDPPYCVAVYEADHTMMDSGRIRYENLMAMYSTHLKSNRWPGYSEMIQPIGVPQWHLQNLTQGEL